MGGGAIYSNKQLSVTRSTFTDNQSSRGGAIFNPRHGDVSNSTLTSNSGNEGSGIHNRGVLTLTHVTGSNGGALFNWNGTLYLRNSIIDYHNGGTLASNLNNLASSSARLGALGQLRW